MSKTLKKIAFISTDWNDNAYRRKNNKYGGVSYYRLFKPMEALAKEYDVDFYGANITEISKGLTDDEFYDDLTNKYDMIIVKQIDNATSAQLLVHYSKHNKCILVQDFDDNMLVVREDQPAYQMGYNPGGTRWAYAASMMSLADALIVSTDNIKNYFSKFIKDNFKEDKDIYVFPNYNDVKDWNYPQPKRKKEDTDKIVIGWAGSVTHDADLKIAMPAIGKIMEKYPNVYLELLGGILQGKLAYLTQSIPNSVKDRIRVVLGTPAWDKYPGLMMSQSWDIGIAPLLDDEFNRSKSHIKWMEYTMMRIPTIASNVSPYKDWIKNKETGLLSNDDNWEENLESLVKDEILRKSLSENAFNHIKNNLQYTQHQKEYLEIVANIFNKSPYK